MDAPTENPSPDVIAKARSIHEQCVVLDASGRAHADERLAASSTSERSVLRSSMPRPPEVRAGIAAVRSDYGLAADYSYPYELYWELADNEQKHAFQMAIMAVIGAGIGNDFNPGGGRIGGPADAADSLNITAALVQRGYEAADVAKIWGENFLRVMRAVESSIA